MIITCSVGCAPLAAVRFLFVTFERAREGASHFGASSVARAICESRRPCIGERVQLSKTEHRRCAARSRKLSTSQIPQTRRVELTYTARTSDLRRIRKPLRLKFGAFAYLRQGPTTSEFKRNFFAQFFSFSGSAKFRRATIYGAAISPAN